MSKKLWTTIRERKDRPGKWLVDVRRGAERSAATFSSYEEARAYEREVRRADRGGELATAEEPRINTLRALCDDFLATKAKQGLAASTLETYRVLLERSVLPALGADRNPRSITEEEVTQFRDGRLSQVKPTTVFRELDRLRALLAHAKTLGLISANAAERVPMPKVPRKSYDWLRSTEIGPFLDATVGDFGLIAGFTILTGLRRREIVFLQRGDVDLRNNVIQVRAKRALGFTPKNGKERSVPLDPVLRPLVERHLQEVVRPDLGAWVFPQRDGTRRSGSTRWFAVATQEAAKRAGIERRLTFHDLRRTYGAMCIEAGLDIYEVSRLLGHSDIRITQEVYAPICGRFLAERASKLGRYLGPQLTREVSTVPALPISRNKMGA